jgi:sRNA-binding carbon storage regulator CsrA
MLQLTLEKGEYVMIGEDIKVSYDRLNSGQQLVLSFDVPRDIKILRQFKHEEMLMKNAGVNTPEGQLLSAQFQAAREDRERAAKLRMERLKTKNKIKKELRKTANN